MCHFCHCYEQLNWWIAVSSIGAHYFKLYVFVSLILFRSSQTRKAAITHTKRFRTVEKWREKNSRNAPLRNNKMWSHKFDLKRGEWTLTHQLPHPCWEIAWRNRGLAHFLHSSLSATPHSPSHSAVCSRYITKGATVILSTADQLQ